MPGPGANQNHIALRTTACNGALVLERRAHLEGACLILHYSIANQGDAAQSLLYSAHPLLRVEAGDRISLPAEVTHVRLEGSAADRLGRRGDMLPWPASSQTRPHADVSGSDLSIVGPPDGSLAAKLFAGPLRMGWCALFRPSLGEGVELTFSVDTLPYLGLWICRAAWPEASPRKQYTVAFEPASAPHDSLTAAEQDGTAWRLFPGERREWKLAFRLIRLGEGHDRQPGSANHDAARETA